MKKGDQVLTVDGPGVVENIEVIGNEVKYVNEIVNDVRCVGRVGVRLDVFPAKYSKDLLRITKGVLYYSPSELKNKE